ncbi:uncharacterized protein LOC143430660 [Xylocopa sonorina]|uniref:uncharacterized protein LOC143430660 n=1 Tax=Xylocopa sonorina TaxID=1818115 RepID=UPI00403A8D4A
MRKRVTPESAISFTKLSVALTCSWPVPSSASKSQLVLFNVLWCAAFTSSFALVLPLATAIYEHHADAIVLGKTVSLTAAVMQVLIKMVMCRLQQKQFQILYFDMETFCKNATNEERVVLQRYVDRYKYFHCVYISWCFLTTILVISGPLYSPETFPTNAIYPFSVEHQPLKSVIFLHQSFVGFQVSSGMAIDSQIALLLRYTAARFELLGSQLRNAKSDCELNACIEKHNQLLRYTKRIRRSIRFLILTTITTTSVAVIFGSLNLITKQPLPLKALYAIVVFSASVELFMYAWPADTLTHMSSKIAADAYNTKWFETHVGVQKKILCIILRSQKLEAIQVSAIVPKLSLPYYAQYLYKSLSYFTALRIMVENTSSIEALLSFKKNQQCNYLPARILKKHLDSPKLPIFTLIHAEVVSSKKQSQMEEDITSEKLQREPSCVKLCLSNRYVTLSRRLVMFRNATPEKAIAFVQLSVALTCCLPLPSTATKTQSFRFKALRFVVFLNAFMLLAPLVYSVHVHRSDPGNMFKAASLILAIFHVLTQTSFCIAQYHRFQRLIEEMQFCCVNADAFERRVFQRYVDKYSTFYGLSAMWFYATACIVIFATLFISDPFPTNAEYPFRVDFEPLRSIIFVHQAIVGFQCAAHICMNIFYALLLLFAAARFEIVMIELSAINDFLSLIKCIKRYQTVKRYAEDVVRAVRMTALVTVTLGGVACVFCGITIIGRQPLAVKVQLFSLAMTGQLEVFMCALAADHLIDMSDDVMQGAYESKWYVQPVGIQKCLTFVLSHQSSVVLSVKCVIPALSLNYYASFISNVFSLFTALRVVMLRDEEDN